MESPYRRPPKEGPPKCHGTNRVREAISVAAPFLAPTQLTNLALLVGAILKKRTL